MINHSLSKPWPKRVLDFFKPDTCRCGAGASGCPQSADQGCSCFGNDLCVLREWAAENEAVPKPDQPALDMVPAGEKTHIEQLFLPLAQKKRLLSLGLTHGTEIAVISNENGRLIIAVRDSRLGLSPEIASRITYQEGLACASR